MSLIECIVFKELKYIVVVSTKILLGPGSDYIINDTILEFKISRNISITGFWISIFQLRMIYV